MSSTNHPQPQFAQFVLSGTMEPAKQQKKQQDEEEEEEVVVVRSRKKKQRQVKHQIKQQQQQPKQQQPKQRNEQKQQKKEQKRRQNKQQKKQQRQEQTTQEQPRRKQAGAPGGVHVEVQAEEMQTLNAVLADLDEEETLLKGAMQRFSSLHAHQMHLQEDQCGDFAKLTPVAQEFVRVPNRCMGVLCGRNMRKIKELSQEHDCQIVVPPRSEDPEGVALMTLVGTTPATQQCAAAIEKTVQQYLAREHRRQIRQQQQQQQQQQGRLHAAAGCSGEATTAALTAALPPLLPSWTDATYHVFIDYSNVMAGAKAASSTATGADVMHTDVHVKSDNLLALLTQGRQVGQCELVGTIIPRLVQAEARSGQMRRRQSVGEVGKREWRGGVGDAERQREGGGGKRGGASVSVSVIHSQADTGRQRRTRGKQGNELCAAPCEPRKKAEARMCVALFASAGHEALLCAVTTARQQRSVQAHMHASRCMCACMHAPLPCSFSSTPNAQPHTRHITCFPCTLPVQMLIDDKLHAQMLQCLLQVRHPHSAAAEDVESTGAARRVRTLSGQDDATSLHSEASHVDRGTHALTIVTGDAADNSGQNSTSFLKVKGG